MIINNRYRLVEKLGHGGVGVVYKALDRLTGDFVALKQMKVTAADLQLASPDLNGETGDKNLALAFEFRTLAGLRHPNVVTVLDYGFDEDQQPFFTMQLIENAKAITRYKVDLGIADKVQLLLEMLQALTYLHRRGIIHRDLKPSNVLVTENGSIKVMDFGLAISHSQTISTGQEGLAGTLAYMAPELFEGGQASIESDLFAVGVIAYELFTGRYPFDNKNTALLLYSIVTGTADTSMLELSLAAVLDKLLAKKPHARYDSASAVIEALCHATTQPLPTESVSIRESYLQASEFVGRQEELNTLKSALDSILTTPPSGSAWLIGGESGVGKSRLVDELRIRAIIRGALVLRGQGVSSRGVLYQLWRDPIRRLALSSNLDDADMAILKEIVPDIDDLLGRNIPTIAALKDQEHQERLVGTIVSVFQRQKRPILLILEDLQWVTVSLEPLKPLINMAQHLPLLIIGTYRDDELPDLPAQLPGMHVIKLDRLTDQAIEELCVSMLGEAGKRRELTDFLKRETEGNAFFMVEVVRILAEDAGRLADIGRRELPKSVFAGGMKDIILNRLSRVPDWGQGLLRMAAVVGREINPKIMELVSSQHEEWLTVCANAAVIEIRDGQWRFSHDKLREALLAHMAADERARLHRQVAEIIETVYPDDNTRVAVLLEHWREAGDTEREIYYAERAVEQHLAASNFRQVVDISTRTLPEVRHAHVRAKMRCQLGEALFGLGNVDQAWEAFEQSLALAREIGDQVLETRCLKNLGDVWLRQGNHPLSCQYYEQSLELARAINDRMSIARNLENLGDAASIRSDFVTARVYYEQSLEISRQLDDKRGIAGSLSGLGWVASSQSEYSTSRFCFEQSLEIARAIGDRRMVARSLGNLGAVASAQGDYTTARDYYRQQLQIHYETGLKAGIAWSLWALSRLLLFQSEYAAASNYNQQSLVLNSELGDKTYAAANLRVSGQIAYMLGDFPTARTCYEECLALAQEIGQKLGITEGLIFMGQISMAQGDYSSAQTYFERGLSLTRELNFMDGIANALNGLGWLAALQGNYPAAEDYYTEALSIAREITFMDGIIVNLLHLGLLAGFQDDHSSAVMHFNESLTIARKVGFRARAAAVLVCLGFLFLAQGEAAVALQNLVAGLDLACQIGTEPIILEAMIGMAAYYLQQNQAEESSKLVKLARDHPSVPAWVAQIRLLPLLASLETSVVEKTYPSVDIAAQQILKRHRDSQSGAGP